MKKNILLVAVFAITVSASAQMKVLSNGNVIIGNATSSTEKFYVGGTVRFHAWTDAILDWTGNFSAPVLYPTKNYYLHMGKDNLRLGDVFTYNIWSVTQPKVSSDARIKENIINVENPIAKIKQVSGYYFNLKREIFPEDLPEEAILEMRKRQIGFLAQELEEVFPELVTKPESEDGFYSVSYEGMIPVLLEAIKEQQNKIEDLEFLLSKQETEMKLIKEQIESNYQYNQGYSPSNNMPRQENFTQTDNAKLFQNNPNPFSTDTEIRFEIPENASWARLLIHDMQGTEIKSYIITQKGAGTIIVHGYELSAGMYLYTLLVDNAITDTKRMILTK